MPAPWLAEAVLISNPVISRGPCRAAQSLRSSLLTGPNSQPQEERTIAMTTKGKRSRATRKRPGATVHDLSVARGSDAKGGAKRRGAGSWLEALAKAMGETMNEAAAK